MSSLNGKEILLGVSGGIACYKAVEILRGLKKAGAEVQVVMTDHARQFVQPLTFQTLSNRSVGTTLFDLERESRIGHIHMAEQAQLALVAPCTANVAAKLRAGIADDLLTTVLLATTAPIYLALAMNDNMLANTATRENLQVLEKRGFTIIPPDVGFLAEGRDGPGRLADPAAIVARVETHFSGTQAGTQARTPDAAVPGAGVLGAEAAAAAPTASFPAVARTTQPSTAQSSTAQAGSGAALHPRRLLRPQCSHIHYPSNFGANRHEFGD